MEGDGCRVDAIPDQVLEDVFDDGPPRDRQQRRGPAPGQRAQSQPVSAGQDDRAHVSGAGRRAGDRHHAAGPSAGRVHDVDLALVGQARQPAREDFQPEHAAQPDSREVHLHAPSISRHSADGVERLARRRPVQLPLEVDYVPALHHPPADPQARQHDLHPSVVALSSRPGAQAGCSSCRIGSSRGSRLLRRPPRPRAPRTRGRPRGPARCPGGRAPA